MRERRWPQSWPRLVSPRWPQTVDLQSLRGRGAARAIRTIIDTAPPFGTRELASTTSASTATLSRVLELLEREAIVTRQPRGPVLAVDWQAAVRRWAEDYDQTNSNTATTFLDPRGIPSIEKKLRSTKLTYAATGAFAAQRFNPIAPARTTTRDGLRCVALSQLAVDLLTGPGRARHRAKRYWSG